MRAATAYFSAGVDDDICSSSSFARHTHSMLNNHNPTTQPPRLWPARIEIIVRTGAERALVSCYQSLDTYFNQFPRNRAYTGLKHLHPLIIITMSNLVGKPFPEGVTFTYVEPTPEKSEVTACGIPIKYDASKEFKDKKVVIVAVPGAFTPTCQADHLSGYIKKLGELKKGGVDRLIFIAYNDPFVMSAWGKANGITDDKIVSSAIVFHFQLGCLGLCGPSPMANLHVIQTPEL